MNLLFLMGKNKNMHQLSKEINMTTSHLSNVTDQWQREGIIVKNLVGRELDINLTDKGKELVELLGKYDSISKMEQRESTKGQVIIPISTGAMKVIKKLEMEDKK